MNVKDLITEHLDIWTTAVEQKKTGGRGRGKKANDQSLYGIKKLRELILDLAVRGKLVEQNPDDEPASVLLEKIAEDKGRLIKEEKIKKQKKLPEITEEEKPFDLPDGWEWVRLGNLAANTHYGYTASASHDNLEIRFLRITDIQNDSVNWETVPGCEIEENKAESYLLTNNDILIARTGGTIGKSYLVAGIDIKAVFASYLIRVQQLEEMFFPFIKTFLGSQLYWLQLYENSMGTGQPNVNATALKGLRFPLPPLAEQHRIVTKVDELMALCDQLEQKQTTSNATHQTLLKTLLTTLINSADHQDFTTAWERIASHFDILFTTEQSIDQLKQTILQLAVMGKLVPQNPEDEPASVLLEKIAKEKTRLIKEGKVKKQKKLPEITEEGKPFDLPDGWEWVRLGNLAANTHYGYTASASHDNLGIRFLRITDIQNDSVNWETVPGCEIEENKAESYLLTNNDILIARTGGTIGKSYLVAGIDIKAVFASYLIRVQQLEEMFFPFIKTFLGSQLYWLQLYKNSMGTGQPNVNATALKGLRFPLPPFAEQQRIVAKVDELMSHCDNLKTRLQTTQTTKLQIADTIVKKAVA